jgi:RNA polymerase sigma-70 factor (ECF subfamily)
LSTWLYAIARSNCIKRRRKSKFAPAREQSLEQDAFFEAGGVADTAQGPDEETQSKELRVVLERAIYELEPEQREALLLRDIEGLKASEVAQVLGISVAAVKSRLHRARIRLRELVAPDLGMPAVADASSACPDVLMLYSQHVEGEISAELCATMERHLEGCERCRSTCDSLKRTLSLCSHLPAVEVPVSVQDSVRTAVRAFLDTAP